MKPKFLLPIVAVIVLASCSTTYKTGQTPDDVYYSKGKERVENARYDRSSDDSYYYDDRMSSAEERRLRMRMRDYRWRQLDEYDYYYGSRYGGYYDYYSYRYSPYSTHYYSPYSYYNSSVYFPYYSGYYPNRFYNGFYSPYFGIPAGSKGYIMQAQNNNPRKVNLDAYREAYRNNNAVDNKGVRQPTRVYRQPRLDNGYERRSQPTYSRPSSDNNSSNSRTYSPSSNNNSGSNSSGTRSSGSISRPSRGGN